MSPPPQTSPPRQKYSLVLGVLHAGDSLRVPSPQWASSPPPSFEGSCAACVEAVAATASEIVQGTDYNGVGPFVAMVNQLLGGTTTVARSTVRAHENSSGEICAGVSSRIVDTLQSTHGVRASFAVDRSLRTGRPGHAGVIVTCHDGVVFIDSRPGSEPVSIPFGATVLSADKTYIASARGARCPLVVASPAGTVAYYVGIQNGAEIINKAFMIYAMQDIIPVVAYQGKVPIKSMVVQPKQQRIRFKDHKTGQTFYVPFAGVSSEETKEQITTFMGTDFRISAATAYRELSSLISQWHLLTRVCSAAGGWSRYAGPFLPPKLIHQRV